MVEGAEAAARIAQEHRDARKQPAEPKTPFPIAAELGTVREIVRRNDQYEIQYLRTGEIVSVNVPGAILGPSEMDQLIAELKIVQSRLKNQ